jgi:plastocyanin
VKRLMYVMALSAIAVLVFAAIAVAQDVPTGQQEGQEPSPPATDTNVATDTNSTSLQKRITSSPATKEPAESSAPAPNSTTTVDINDDAFNPAQLNIAPGTTVKFENKDTVAHTATADNDVFDTNRLEPGESMEVYFEGAGTVTYHDDLHPDMKGTIVVGEDVGEEEAAPQGEDAAPQKGTAEEAQNTEPSSSEADQPATEAAPPLKG